MFRCESCENSALLSEKECKKCALKYLRENFDKDSIILEKNYKKKYFNLNFLKKLDNISKKIESFLREKTTGDCDICYEERKYFLEKTFEEILENHKKGAFAIRETLNIKSVRKSSELCESCNKKYTNILKDILEELEKMETKEFSFYITPYFSNFFLDLRVPKDFILVDKFSFNGGSLNIYFSKKNQEHYVYIFLSDLNISYEEIELLKKVHKELCTNVREEVIFSKDHLKKYIFDLISNSVKKDKENIDRETRIQKISDFYTNGIQYSILEPIMSLKVIQNCYINPPYSNPIIVEIDDYGTMETNVYLEENEVIRLSERFKNDIGRPLDLSHPILDGKINDSRIMVTRSPFTEKTTISIRNFRFKPWTLPLFIKRGYLSPWAASFLDFANYVDLKFAILGSKDSGKTSLLISIVGQSFPTERIIYIEDTNEFPYDQFSKHFKGIVKENVSDALNLGGEGYDILPDKAIWSTIRSGDAKLYYSEIRTSLDARPVFEAIKLEASRQVGFTIHAMDVPELYTRTVIDLGASPQSFKSLDFVVQTKKDRIFGTEKRTRKVLSISEINKDWLKGIEELPRENWFLPLFFIKDGNLVPNKDILLRKNGILEKRCDELNIETYDAINYMKWRSKSFETMIKLENKKNSILELDFVVRSNKIWRVLMKNSKEEFGKPLFSEVYEKWEDWILNAV